MKTGHTNHNKNYGNQRPKTNRSRDSRACDAEKESACQEANDEASNKREDGRREHAGRQPAQFAASACSPVSRALRNAVGRFGFPRTTRRIHGHDGRAMAVRNTAAVVVQPSGDDAARNKSGERKAHRLAGRNGGLKRKLYDYTKRKQHAGGEFGAATG